MVTHVMPVFQFVNVVAMVVLVFVVTMEVVLHGRFLDPEGSDLRLWGRRVAPLTPS
ncbi:MAG: hypothetical protein ACE5KH_05170 [Candidatus Geothermarchaeales archaeon]